MALISLRQLLDHAAEHSYGLPAFNVNNMEQIQAIMQAAEACASPVILQASAGARKYAGEPFLRKLVEAAIEQYPDIPVCLHQDHGTSPVVCQQSMRSGFSSVMMDGSLGPDGKTPASYAYNVLVTRKVVEMAHAIGVSVDNAMFADMNKNNLKLGDYDYANGALPDGSWNANRIAAWVNALKPVCNSPEMKAKYPALPENLPTLLRAAWGHVPSAEDTADFQNAIAAVSSDPAVVYESTCMAVFTAAEFVYR